MPPEPLPWDQKDFFKERKHESLESLGPVSRWRDCSLQHGFQEFSRWGSADFHKPPGHDKQRGWHLYPEESGCEYAPSQSAEDESCRPSVSHGDLKYGRNIREIKGSFNAREWKDNSLDSLNGFPNTNGRPHNLSNDKSSVDDIPTCPSHPHSEFRSACNQLQLNDQHNKMGGANGFGRGQRCEVESVISSTDWKPLNRNRPGSISSKGSGFSHSSSSKSMGGVDYSEVKAESQPKNATPVQSPSGDATCITDSVVSEEMNSRKKPRLGWGEGLAKYEKKREGPVEKANNFFDIFPSSNTEPVHSHTSNLNDKSPRTTHSSDCASPATPSSVACSSAPGLDDNLYKMVNVDSAISNLCLSPEPESHSHSDGFSFNLDKVDINSIANLGSSPIDLLHTEDLSSFDSKFLSSATNKLLVLKVDILKAVEKTESEIESLENELKTLKPESGSSFPFFAISSCLPDETELIPCQEQGVLSDCSLQPAPLQAFEVPCIDKTSLCTRALDDTRASVMDVDVDSSGTATSKFSEPLPLLTSAEGMHGDCSEDFDGTQTPYTKVESSMHKSNGKPSISTRGNDKNAYSPVHRINIGEDNKLSQFILASNKEYAGKSMEVFSKQLPREMCEVDDSGVSSLKNDLLVIQKFAMKNHFLKFKERVITFKFKAFHHMWKEDLHLLSLRRNRLKSQKKIESGLRTLSGGLQKHRSSIRSQFSSGILSLLPTTEIINFSSKLMLDSRVKLYRNISKMPELILDKEKKRFISSNGLVEDPCAVENERVRTNPWTDEEREIFMEKLAVFGKVFGRVSSFLAHKTTADCVEFYYKNQKTDSFEKTKKKLNVRKQGKPTTSNYMVTTGKRWNSEMNAASLDNLSVASVMVARTDSSDMNRQIYSRGFVLGGQDNPETTRGDDGFLETSSSFDFICNDRETVAADVLAGICSSFSSEAMSSCVTSSVDPVEDNKERKFQKVDSVTKRPLTPEVTQNVDNGTCSDDSCGEIEQADWTNEEKSIFIHAVSSYGKDFARISQCVRTRSMDQCKIFFSKARKCLGLDLIHQEIGDGQFPEATDGNGGGGDADDARFREIVSVIRNDDPGSKLDQDLPLFVMKIKPNECAFPEIISTHDDLKNSKKSNAVQLLNHKDVRPVKTLIPDSCQTGVTPAVDCDAESSVMNIDEKHDPVLAPKTAIICTNMASRGSEVDQATFQEKSNVKEVCRSSYAMVEGKDVAGAASQESENRTLECNLDLHTIGFQCPVQNSDSTGDAPNPETGTDCGSGFSVKPECHDQASGRYAISVKRESSLVTANYVAQCPVTGKCEETLDEDCLSLAHDFKERRVDQCHETVSNDEFHHSTCGCLSNSIISSHVLRGYPLQVPTQKEVNVDASCRMLPVVQSLPKFERNLTGDRHLQECNSSKPICSVADLPLLAKNPEKKTDGTKTHTRSLSDTNKPHGNGDVKLFGKILTLPSSRPTLNSNGRYYDDKGTYQQKSSGIKMSTPKVGNGQNSVDRNSALVKFDYHNYQGLQNVPKRSCGFWDGKRIHTGLPALSDSAILVSKYPAAFGNYPISSKTEQHLLPIVIPSSGHKTNSISVSPTRKLSNGNELADYQVYDDRAQTHTVDMNHTLRLSKSEQF